jgi:hypothetical protein
MKTFKNNALVMVLLFVVSTSFQYQTQKDITGKWTFSNSPSNDSLREIEIYSENNKYYGKIIKVSGENKKEKVGHIMLKDLVYDQTEKKYNGEANSPSGMTASCELILLDENKLQINVQKFYIIRKSYILTRIK